MLKLQKRKAIKITKWDIKKREILRAWNSSNDAEFIDAFMSCSVVFLFVIILCVFLLAFMRG